MSQLEERLNALLSNPQLMQQIASMAQSMGAESQSSLPEPKEAPLSAPDPRLLQAMAQSFGQAGIDSNQKQLLHALRPYLSAHRVRKLERAIEAARLAGAASTFLSAGGLQLLSGR